MRILTFLFVLILCEQNSFALLGGMETGGGKVVVCRNSDHTIKSTELLDLYEGRVIYGLEYKELNLDWKTQARNIFYLSTKPEESEISIEGVPLPDANSHVGGDSWFENTILHLQFLPDGTTLKPINDSLEPINFPAGCNAEQAVNYMNDNLILVNGEIWAALSQTQKAALGIHESVYRDLRTYGETDSRRARHYTAHIMSGRKIESGYRWDGDFVSCNSAPTKKATSFLAMQVADMPHIVRVGFSFINGRKLLSTSYIDFQRYDEKDSSYDFLKELAKPTKSKLFKERKTQSLFEAEDSLRLSMGPGASIFSGTSTVDESDIDTGFLDCTYLSDRTKSLPPVPPVTTPSLPVEVSDKNLLGLKIYSGEFQNSNSELFRETGTPACKTSKDLSDVNCTVQIPQSRLYYSKLQLQISWFNSANCQTMTFQPYYYQMSSSATYLPPTGGSSIDCSTGSHAQCYGGVAPELITDFPVYKNNNYMAQTKIPTPNAVIIDLKSAGNMNYHSNRFTVNDLPVSKRSRNYSSDQLGGLGDSYIADSFVDYNIACVDDFGNTTQTIHLFIQDAVQRTDHIKTWKALL